VEAEVNVWADRYEDAGRNTALIRTFTNRLNRIVRIGNDYGYRNGYGDGDGNGCGYGYGYGCGYGNSDGNGNGYGYGNGNGNGNGDGGGYGYGYGYGNDISNDYHQY
jgi:hypothetical protein